MQLTLLSYNWTNDAHACVEKQLRRAVTWHNRRAQLLNVCVAQKLGLFNHQQLPPVADAERTCLPSVRTCTKALSSASIQLRVFRQTLWSVSSSRQVLLPVRMRRPQRTECVTTPHRLRVQVRRNTPQVIMDVVSILSYLFHFSSGLARISSLVYGSVPRHEAERRAEAVCCVRPGDAARIATAVARGFSDEA